MKRWIEGGFIYANEEGRERGHLCEAYIMEKNVECIVLDDDDWFENSKWAG